MAKIMSARKAGEMMDLPHKEVIRRIRKKDIKAHKIDGAGWNWVLYEDDVKEAMEAEWYKKTHK